MVEYGNAIKDLVARQHLPRRHAVEELRRHAQRQGRVLRLRRDRIPHRLQLPQGARAAQRGGRDVGRGLVHGRPAATSSPRPSARSCWATPAVREVFMAHHADCSTASTATTGCSARPAPRPSSASRRPTGTASSARRRAHRVLRPARGRGGRAAAERVQGGDAADGRVAAGQAALHRPADRPPPARAGRDLLQLGDHQDPAPQLLPERLHLRAPGGLDRAHREQRAGGAPTYRAYYPTQRDAAPRPGSASSPTSSSSATSRTSARRRRA